MLFAAPPQVGGAYQDLPQLCPYAAAGHCYYEDNCTYLHGDLCEVCRLQVLHPHDPEQRRAHEKVRTFIFLNRVRLRWRSEAAAVYIFLCGIIETHCQTLSTAF